jgi:uncharacterized protein (DUF1697 family)
VQAPRPRGIATDEPFTRSVTMAIFVALLRAVNVGGRSVGMADLRQGLEGLGYGRVRTYVQSGNIVFEAEDADPREHAAAIEGVIARDFGLESKVLVLTASEMSAIAAANPLITPGADEKRLHVTFLFAPADAAAFAALPLPARDGEQASLLGRVVYLHLPHGYGRSKLNNAYFERAFKTPATTRNWRTVTTLAGLASPWGRTTPPQGGNAEGAALRKDRRRQCVRGPPELEQPDRRPVDLAETETLVEPDGRRVGPETEVAPPPFLVVAHRSIEERARGALAPMSRNSPNVEEPDDVAFQHRAQIAGHLAVEARRKKAHPRQIEDEGPVHPFHGRRRRLERLGTDLPHFTQGDLILDGPHIEAGHRRRGLSARSAQQHEGT